MAFYYSTRTRISPIQSTTIVRASRRCYGRSKIFHGLRDNQNAKLCLTLESLPHWRRVLVWRADRTTSPVTHVLDSNRIHTLFWRVG